ncbi:hypothetical protein FGO68_gene14185 [Halteria grandinella]|uniref:Ion transport domain-containing protein n=1 Tax=Halteria grandinella TaxID=5974 RepID=A0A8J8P4X1_HALGN|nr:hypothetical protein FGO68_gene14185 [Halteria grandinella]
MTQKELIPFHLKRDSDNVLQLPRKGIQELEKDQKYNDGSSRVADSPRKSPKSLAEYRKGSTQKSVKGQSNKHEQQSSSDYIAFKQSLISGRNHLIPRPSGEQSSVHLNSNQQRQSHIDGNSSDTIAGGMSKTTSQLAKGGGQESVVNALGVKVEWSKILQGHPQKKKLTREKQRDFHHEFTKGPQAESDDIKIKKNIEKLDAQDIFRNTRFFKDLLKDKMREQLKRGSTIRKNNGSDSENPKIRKSLKVPENNTKTGDDSMIADDTEVLPGGGTKQYQKMMTTYHVGDREKRENRDQGGNYNSQLRATKSFKIHQDNKSKKVNTDDHENGSFDENLAGGEYSNQQTNRRKSSKNVSQIVEDRIQVEDVDQEASEDQSQNDSKQEFNSSQHQLITDQGGVHRGITLKRLQSQFDAFTALDHQDQEDEEEQYEEQIKRINSYRYNKYLIMPESDFRTAVDAISFVLLLFISLYIPFVISYNVDTSGFFENVEFFIDVWFLFEIFINFFTGFYEKGTLVMHLPRILKSYICGYFFADVLSSVPISFFSNDQMLDSISPHALQSAKFIRMIRMTRYLRLLRLVRFVKVSKLMQAFEVLIVSEQASLIMRFLNICFFVVFIAHWIACVLYSVTEYETDEGVSWLYLQNLQDASISEKYVNALYWVITTTCTVGYGDFHPTTTAERVVVMVCMLVQSGMFAYIIGDISRMVSNFNLLATHFKERMNYVEKFLREKDIPINLRQQVKRYLEYNWETPKRQFERKNYSLFQREDSLKYRCPWLFPY